MMHKTFLSKIGCVIAIAGAVFIPATAKANVTGTTRTLIDWDQLAPGWTAPKSGQVRTYNSGEGTFDIRFDLGATTRFDRFGGGSITPNISGTLNGSQGLDNKSLHIQMDAQAVGLAKGANSVTMTTAFNGFSSPLKDVSFTLYDVDIDNTHRWQDRVILKGFLGNQVVQPLFTPILNTNTIQIVDDHTVDGIGFDANVNKDNGNVLVKFASAIDRFELVFTDGDDIGNINPRGHGIGIGDITYTYTASVVPEPASVLGLLAFGTFGLSSVLKRKQEKA